MSSEGRRDSPQARIRRARAIGLCAAGLVALVLGVLLAVSSLGEPNPELPVLGEMPSFELVDHRGEPAAAEDYRGAPLVANFIFTRCPTVCPVFTMKMEQVSAETEDLGPELKLVSFSVDPEHDTPERLASYANEYDVDHDRWSFLTGDPAEIERTVRDGLHIAMEEEGEFPDGTPDIIHNTHFVLLDDDLQIRGYYDSNDAERIEELVRDARYLADKAH